MKFSSGGGRRASDLRRQTLHPKPAFSSLNSSGLYTHTYDILHITRDGVLCGQISTLMIA
jgi:hypothetical protein